jgi:hypothetical protein
MNVATDWPGSWPAATPYRSSIPPRSLRPRSGRIRASSTGRRSARRLPGTARDQSRDANDLDRPDPENIPEGIGASRFRREAGGGGAIAHYSRTSRGNKIGGCAVLLDDG